MEHNPPLSVTFRHSGWVRVRRLVCEALRRTNQTFSRREQFCYCGSHAYVLQSIDDPSVYRIAGSCCRDRFCLPCANERAHSIALNVNEAVTGHPARFLTLTVKSEQETLADLLDKLYSAFQSLRRRTFWKKRVTGGVAFLEVKWNNSKQRWHPHFHMIIQGSFLPHRQLSKLWYEITGDSHIVDIRIVRDPHQAVRYVTKYASKPFNDTFVNRPQKLDEAIVALHARKLILTFGSWRGVLLAVSPSTGAWQHYDTLDNVILQAAQGNSQSRVVLASITTQDLQPLYARAPPITPIPSVPPPIPQLTWLGVWQNNGTWQDHHDP